MAKPWASIKAKFKKHVLGEVECLMNHYDNDGNPIACCRRCLNCEQWVRPEEEGKPCSQNFGPCAS